MSFFLFLSVVALFLGSVSCTLISDGSSNRALSLFILDDEGAQLGTIHTDYSIIDQYTSGIADPDNGTAYLLVSDPPSIIWPDRTYAIVTVNLHTSEMIQSSATFKIPGVYPYGITLGPDGKVIVSGQSLTVLYYYLVDPATGVQVPLTQIDIQNSFIFPDTMLYDPKSNKLYHPYCNEPEQFIGVVVVDVSQKTSTLLTASGTNLPWYRPVVYNPFTQQLVGLLRSSQTTDATTLATFSLQTLTFTTVGVLFNGTEGVTFEGADLSDDGKTLFVTGSNGLFGTGLPFLFSFDVSTGKGSVVPLPSDWLPDEFLTYSSKF